MRTPTAAEAEVVRIGVEGRPVVVIENFVDQPDIFAAEAAALDFAPIGRFYPGVKARFELGRLTRMAEPLQELLGGLFGGSGYAAVDAAFSLVTTHPSGLHALQRIPHIDTAKPHIVALLVYLSGAQFGGTAFYRHRSTGYEYVDEGRSAAYTSALDRDVERFGPPASGYLAGDTPLFEMIAAFDARPGRALIYSAQSLHSGLIRSPERLTDDPRTGRLTLNGFLAATSSIQA